ncbi:uncharacterized protein F4812DRAFT_461365 [Daldinia caldariorum]|uniref:uncharacterized protein n=1 Tax=Daldinia caldariorum TaxID=326644 RepID=UPI002008BF1F|nr:uncharacterized protein F4812DRAFT_461365 [Daldinia caldariorum]KAI1465669.1 hypothetical protein F4812DRAFT_461365 [Daldinia caldariorum]
MKSFTLATVVAALASSASAVPKQPSPAQVNLIAINHSVSGAHTDQLIAIDIATLTHKDNVPITGFAVDSISVTVPAAPGQAAITKDDIVCQRFQDRWGTQRGSAAFTSAKNASVSTNSVDFGYVLCYVTPTA